MARFKYYINYGSGFVEINPRKISLKLGRKKGEINPLIQRTYLEGSFSLIETQAATAYTYFIANTHNSAPFKIYEHGTNLTGTLVFNGEISLSGLYDISATIMQFDKFKTIDEYSPIIDILTYEVTGESLPAYGSYVNDFTSQGLNANADKLKAFTYSGGVFSAAGNAYSLTTIGRPSMCLMGTKIVIFDDYTRTLKSFDFDGTNYTPSTNGTSLYVPSVLVATYGPVALVAYDTDKVSLYISGADIKLNLQAVSGTWSYISDSAITQTEYPSAAYLTANKVALVDELSNELKYIGLGSPLTIGDCQRPKVCKIDTDTVAVLNSKTGTLQAYVYSTEWKALGAQFSIGVVFDATICQAGTNIVHVHDTYSGTIRYYSFNGTVWTQTGTGTTFAGGLSSAMVHDGTYTHIVISDSHVFGSQISPNMQAVIDKVLDDKNLTDYEFVDSTCGATFDIENLYMCNIQNVVENPAKALNQVNDYKYSIGECLKIAEIFQNYWYLELVSGKYQIKFKKPSQFSSVGSDINVTAPALNQRYFQDIYFIKREKITFNNEYHEDFVGDWIEYDKNTIDELTTNYNYTTDLGYLVGIYNKRIVNKQISNSGLLLIIGGLVEAGTSPLSNTNVRNEALSKTRIYEDYMKDYRYAVFGTFTMNENTVSVQDTCKPVIQFPDVEFKSTNFISLAASFNWGSYKSYITQVEIDLQTYKFTGQSVLLDL